MDGKAGIANHVWEIEELLALIDYNAAMVDVRNLVSVILVLACTGCLTNVRPTVLGQALDATTGRPVPSLVVTVHSVSSLTSGPPVRTTSNRDGKFVCTGVHSPQIWMGYLIVYQVRLHRDEYQEAVYDFNYTVQGGLFGDRKQIGQILLYPRFRKEGSNTMPSTIQLFQTER
jgi:hypothetical protein